MRRITALLLVVVALPGCFGTGVTAGTVRAFGGALEDAALYRKAKRDSDEKMAANLADAWRYGAKLEAELEIVNAAKDGQVPLDSARSALANQHKSLTAASDKLAEIRAAQAMAEIHYQGMTSLMRETHGLLSALADREAVDQQARERAVEATNKAGGLVRSAMTSGVSK